VRCRASRNRDCSRTPLRAEQNGHPHRARCTFRRRAARVVRRTPGTAPARHRALPRTAQPGRELTGALQPDPAGDRPAGAQAPSGSSVTSSPTQCRPRGRHRRARGLGLKLAAGGLECLRFGDDHESPTACLPASQIAAHAGFPFGSDQRVDGQSSGGCGGGTVARGLIVTERQPTLLERLVEVRESV
jgi:hypothetical protein